MYKRLFFNSRQDAAVELIVDGKKTRVRHKKGDDLPSQAIKLMPNDKAWIPMENMSQYTLFGYHHNTHKIGVRRRYYEIEYLPYTGSPA